MDKSKVLEELEVIRISYDNLKNIYFLHFDNVNHPISDVMYEILKHAFKAKLIAFYFVGKTMRSE